ncbi:MAG: DUF1127 domain-containing protein [Alphaproteobacteria bacterium]|nr:DUF1127 domain-containing protein [Alphaproteobacteria bacterium]
MLDIFVRSISRAGGIEVPGDVRIVERPASRPSVLRRLASAFERWNTRRSTYMTLQQLDDRLLKDIGLDRGQLHGVADEIGRRVAANDNALPLALSDLAANDNDRPAARQCI